jgi:hypothetical protein
MRVQPMRRWGRRSRNAICRVRPWTPANSGTDGCGSGGERRPDAFAVFGTPNLAERRSAPPYGVNSATFA